MAYVWKKYPHGCQGRLGNAENRDSTHVFTKYSVQQKDIAKTELISNIMLYGISRAGRADIINIKCLNYPVTRGIDYDKT